MFTENELYEKALVLLKNLIATPSLSREEHDTALLLEGFFTEHKVAYKRQGNNIWALNQYFDSSKPTILLNSHHDTVKPNKGYTRDPHAATVEEGKLYGLGSNDAGGCLVSLITTFLFFYDKQGMAYNFIIAATAEEEISGREGVESILDELGDIAFAIVGEPTLMDMAVAEKGLMVWDCVAKGKAGHAAREEGDNAIYKAMKDIDIIKNYVFDKESSFLGPIKLSVTQINAGYQHNVVPDSCEFVVDVRMTDVYTNEEVVELLQQAVDCEIIPRSTRLKPSSIPTDHPIVLAGQSMGMKLYGSPTTSDQAVIPFQSLKLGPGDSARSHTADEFIYLNEIKEGISKYISVLNKIL